MQALNLRSAKQRIENHRDAKRAHTANKLCALFLFASTYFDKTPYYVDTVGKNEKKIAEYIRQQLQDDSVKVSTGPAQSREGITTKPCQTRDFSGRKEYRTDS